MQKALQKKIMKPIKDKFVWPNRKYFKIPFSSDAVTENFQPRMDPLPSPSHSRDPATAQAPPYPSSPLAPEIPPLRKPQPPSPGRSQSQATPHLPPIPPKKLEPRHTSPLQRRRHSFYEGQTAQDLETFEVRERPLTTHSISPLLQVNGTSEVNVAPVFPAASEPLLVKENSEKEKRSRSRGRAKSRSPALSPREETARTQTDLSTLVSPLHPKKNLAHASILFPFWNRIFFHFPPLRPRRSCPSCPKKNLKR